ncbi:putative acetyltransferase [Rahnella aquatilis CIP 78.65 = ATCC 33071]|uniref:PanD regulatory factor n=1 Tax=Rahnella aquatilis (strain ATCC 33071 / DSM 4594 / JCM 1683 / NBRC 105701 / NCIMB 13365 / CIP 78.65) TaxID=745277 RepID=H2IWL1_RAHAC|nr:aspartate 1-decarboxylase autocleavage activator PanM [Rahnella aquatilis]AEX54060.1 acetyltransferase, N-acetylglutamate synthase [Rahnella aquatilis CIP 78.65 = ATCC 33071]KFD00431.1 putative acetyltransferase [Rahnella aquatilis CIP 78.65 = ATCC 33071]
MKLTIKKLTSLSAQDLICLAKIWPEQTESDWQASLQNNRALFAAVFNERILGAVKITLDGNQGELHDLRVREVTRRRGVGLYLIEDLQAQLPQVKSWTMKADDDAVTAAFMQTCGFTREGNVWKKS